ncbi:MAG: ABC transporter ATP-binding protein [Lachnospiraceae bacterium]|nr:ABC transporter ATP-binding protein [Lachnospiraceae bacterium]
MNDIAIKVENVSKVYRLYDKHRDRLADALNLTRKKKYREHFALDTLSFDIKRGETVGIIGTNGSGKSTILKIITGVLNPTAGKVEVDGRISALLELGAGFNMEYTGIENVYLNGTMIGFTKEEIDERLDDILEFADIGDFVNQPVKTYSSGMFVRLAFAVAINIDPEILIVDEALSVGDVFFQSKCYHKFEEFKKQGKTILFVSHDLGSISKYCDRAILLNKGEKLYEGTPKDAIDLYKRVLVGQLDDDDEDGKTKWEHSDNGELWRTNIPINPEVLEYGNKKAEIVDFVFLDNKGKMTNIVEKGREFSVKVKIHFNEDIAEAICAFSFKNLMGIEITGTSTMFEKIPVEPKKAGDEMVVTFKQKMDLQGGDYLLSLGCTGYPKGVFEVYHRLYDVCNLTVVSTKNSVGYYDMNSQITVEE